MSGSILLCVYALTFHRMGCNLSTRTSAHCMCLI